MAGFELVTMISAHFLRPKKVQAGVAAPLKGVWKRTATAAAGQKRVFRRTVTVAVTVQ